jgi:CheY-like chemotaxis protein
VLPSTSTPTCPSEEVPLLEDALCAPPPPLVFAPRTPQQMELLIPTLSFLVVDDVRCTCEVMITLLRSLGAKSSKLFSATTLFGAMQTVRCHTIDVIISDLNLRVGTGLDLFEAVKNSPQAGKVAFMLVTNEPDADEIKRAKEMGVTAVLLKPLSMANLSEHLGYALR